jgi:hypothetical protein
MDHLRSSGYLTGPFPLELLSKLCGGIVAAGGRRSNHRGQVSPRRQEGPFGFSLATTRLARSRLLSRASGARDSRSQGVRRHIGGAGHDNGERREHPRPSLVV